MNAQERVKTLITALQSRDMEVATNTMADDFVISGWTPYELKRGQFLAIQGALLDALPDFSYNLSDVRETGEGVEAFIHVSGTHTGDLTLPSLDIAPIPATGLAVDLPQVKTTFLVKNEQVTKMQVEDVAGGGLTGILQQVGTELPVQPRLDDFSA